MSPPGRAEERAGQEEDMLLVPLISLAFPGKHKLHAASEFSQVFSARRVLHGKYFSLHYSPSASSGSEVSGVSGVSEVSEQDTLTDRPGARLGLVVAKRLARRAVQRNLLKRLAREAFRHARASLPPYDLVLRLSRPVTNRPSRETHETQGARDMRRIWRSDIDQLLLRLSTQATQARDKKQQESRQAGAPSRLTDSQDC